MTPPKTTRWSAKTVAWLVLLLTITAVSRLACVSHPYFADGPSHVHAIERGILLIQPPGYYLFNLSGQTLAHLLHCSAAQALQVLNLFFGELAVLFFALLCLQRFPQRDAFLLAACYAASPAIWFVADVHSTYASATIFAPLLFLCCEEWDLFPLGCFFWALQAGFRPSDGVFVFPWIIWQGLRHTWRTRVFAVALALPTLLVWLIPTAYRYGGWLGVLRNNRDQAVSVAQGVLTGNHSIHAVMEVVRATAGLLLGWSLLFPVVILALVLRSKASPAIRSTLIWIAPGLLFFTLYFIADSVYVDFLIAPGLIAAGILLQNWRSQWRTLLYLATVTASLLFMLCARPIVGTSNASAVLDAYALKFTRWSLKHEYAPRLAALVGACGKDGVTACAPTR